MFKRTIPAVFMLLLIGKSEAQIVPNGSTISSAQQVQYLPHVFCGGALINYVRAWEPWKPISVDSLVPVDSVPDVKLVTSYVDGLGRVIETVTKQNSPNRKDLVAFKTFDDYGREAFQYLPYPSDSSSGYFMTNPSLQQKTYYSTSSKNNNQYIGEQVYYGQTIFESSPLGRPDTVMAPGNSWAGNKRGIRYQYLINAASDSVRNWTIADAIGSTPSTSSTYSAGELYKTVTIDEHGKQVVEYKDKEGKVILKKVQLLDSPGAGHYGWLCTYYIYDIYGLLRYVIQPKGIEWLADHGWDLTTTGGTQVDAEQCFRYDYDQRNRMIIKKVPGALEVWMVYDARDRLVMTQDANLRAQNKWLYTEYDAADRVLATGILNSSSNRSTHQSSAYGSTSYPNLGSYTHEELTRTFYDNYDWASTPGLGSGFTNIYNYDVYFYTESNTTAPYAQPVAAANLVYGMQTGNKIETLGNSDYEWTVTYYDSRNRVIQTQNIHWGGGRDTVTNQYDFSGKLLRSLVCHKKDAEVLHNYRILTKLEYDDAGRLTSTTKKVDNSSELAIAVNTYDELGQLKTKKLEPAYNSNAGLETLNYEYNIRGWLKSINKNWVNDSSGANNWFGQILSYDWGFSAQQYNGNISGIKWKSKGDSEKRAYGFAYDNMNRFLKADFTQYTTSAWNVTAGIDFSVKMGNGSDATTAYDCNGNILKMHQKGWKLGGSVTIDSLIYEYQNYSNKLKKVTDGVSDANTKLGDFHDGTNTSSDDYGFDDNGNLTFDNNKVISSIHYNFLNLPDTITVTDKGTIIYVYNAAGSKLEKKVIEGSITTVTDYINGFEYRNDTLQQIAHEEGRIRSKADTSFVYDYFIKDHLGNVRMMLTDEQKTDFYPPASMENVEDPNNLSDPNNYIPYYNKTNYQQNSDYRVQIRDIEGYPRDDSYTNPNDYVAKVQADVKRIGPGITLKVMAGDKINIRVSSWYDMGDNNPGHDNSQTDIITDLVASMAGGFSSIPGHDINSSQLDGSSGVLYPAVSSFISDQDNDADPARPLAYVSWLLFDEHFNLVNSSSGYQQVADNENFTVHEFNDLSMDKNGYLYVYVSNESTTIPVYFDNLQVTHIRGPLVEENHYYPFGLQMNGISSKALNFGTPENKKNRFQNQEYNDDLGVDLYEFKYRMDDPQIGRFWQIDPLSEEYVYNSVYAFSENKIIAHIELEGLEAKLAIAGVGHENTHYDPKDIAAFKDRANRLQRIAGFKASQAENGQQIVSTLKQATKDKGSISAIAFFSHSGADGLYLNNNQGFYRDDEFYPGAGGYAGNVNDVKNAMDKGEIKFEKDAFAVFGGCNCAKGENPLAYSFTNETGVTSYGATDQVTPEGKNGVETGRLQTNGEFIKFEKITENKQVEVQIPHWGTITVTVPVTYIKQTNVGNKLDVKDLIRNK